MKNHKKTEPYIVDNHYKFNGILQTAQGETLCAYRLSQNDQPLCLEALKLGGLFCGTELTELNDLLRLKVKALYM